MRRYLMVLMLFLAGCPMDSKQEKESKVSAVPEQAINDSIPEIAWANVKIETEKAAVDISDENLFGKFFEDRIEFHIIDNPEINLHNAQVEQITLYYIDGILCRKKYLLSKDIANQLAAQHGALTYRSLNIATDSLAREMGILLASENGKRFNPYLKKYQLKWVLHDTVIYFQHLEDSLETFNYYIEEVAEYRDRYRSVQKDLL